MAGYVSRGFRLIKIAAGTLEEDTARLKVAREAAGGAKLMYDAHWAWRDPQDALRVVRGWVKRIGDVRHFQYSTHRLKADG